MVCVYIVYFFFCCQIFYYMLYVSCLYTFASGFGRYFSQQTITSKSWSMSLVETETHQVMADNFIHKTISHPQDPFTTESLASVFTTVRMRYVLGNKILHNSMLIHLSGCRGREISFAGTVPSSISETVTWEEENVRKMDRKTRLEWNGLQMNRTRIYDWQNSKF